ncbi:MAG: hypothetical protein LBR22_01950 [Desulfovibrio sp.]|nr:hypothetical protein [Desulfovibrio sp.]
MSRRGIVSGNYRPFFRKLQGGAVPSAWGAAVANAIETDADKGASTPVKSRLFVLDKRSDLTVALPRP